MKMSKRFIILSLNITNSDQYEISSQGMPLLQCFQAKYYTRNLFCVSSELVCEDKCLGIRPVF